MSVFFTPQKQMTGNLRSVYKVSGTVLFVCCLWLPITRVFTYIIQYNLNGSNTDGSFTVDNSNSFFSPYKILPIAQENKYLGIFFLFYHGIVCCLYSLELPH